MRPDLTTLIETSILPQAAALFGLKPDECKKLGGFENYLTESVLNSQPVVLRISHPNRRTKAEIQTELEFIEHLSKNGVPVARPVHSANDTLIEIVEHEDKTFVISCFDKAPGGLVKRDQMTDEQLFNRGQALGMLHKHSRTFKRSSNSIDRVIWYNEEDFADSRKFLPKEDHEIADRMDEIIERLKQFGQSADTWGLCHFDAHHGNVLFDGVKPTLIDFDDASYELFAADLAIPLFYHIFLTDDAELERKNTEHYLTQVLAGYAEQYPLDPRWPEIFPLILKRREIVLYVALYRALDMNNLDDWAKRYFDGRKERIVNRTPITEFDFDEFANRL